IVDVRIFDGGSELRQGAASAVPGVDPARKGRALLQDPRWPIAPHDLAGEIALIGGEDTGAHDRGTQKQRPCPSNGTENRFWDQHVALCDPPLVAGLRDIGVTHSSSLPASPCSGGNTRPAFSA